MACIYRSSERLSLEAWNYMFKKISFTLLLIFFFFLLSFVLYYFHLNSIIKSKFEGRKWDIPSKVFSGNYLLYPGLKLHVQQFEERLERLKYKKINMPHPEQGEYFFNSSHREILDLFIYLHNFHVPTEIKKGQNIHIELQENTIKNITDSESGEILLTSELEPELIALIYENEIEERRVIQLQTVPPDLLNAIISIEDERFFEHKGVDPQGVLRATLRNLKSLRFAQGGSTLTQQLVKNFFLSRKKTLTRKFTEAFMSLMIEAKYTKDQILETYINEIYFGNHGPIAIHGVAEAAFYYFSKDIKSLTLSESALLAGMIQAPNRYSPLVNLERALARRNQVLNKMYEQKKIVRREYVQAKLQTIQVKKAPVEMARQTPYFTDFLKSELQKNFSIHTLSQEGYYIFTTLDVSLQKSAEKSIRNHLNYLEKKKPELIDEKNPLQAALISIEPHTGYIKAMVGGRHYETSQFNRAFQAQRQSGSVFKPFVYAAAFEFFPKKYTPSTTLLDTPFVLKYEGQTWEPQNYDGKFRNEVSLREALESSINIPTARLAWDVGIKNIAQLAKKMGIESSLTEVPSLALGSSNVTPLEIATAYATLANHGFQSYPRAILEVIDSHGELVEKKDISLKSALSPQSAYLLTSLLQGVIERGTGRGVRLMGFDHPAAGKTGTTSDFNDAWFSGYTVHLATTVWVGYDEAKRLGLSGAEGALPLWTHFMIEAHHDKPKVAFDVPENIVFKKIDRETKLLWHKGCPSSFQEIYIEGSEPHISCSLHETVIRSKE
ncbi:MAG TPA: PBP1A family penicillin-binding protein [Bdellovibrionota bacterium]|nr:PBP1A family penicillin-binding protein [Bdellovibrionota bacterium]